MNAMRPARNYDFTEITRLLLNMRDNCVRKADGEAYDDPERKEKYEALEVAVDLINNPSMLQRWISVKERSPEKHQRVLFISTGHERVCVGNYHGEGKKGGHYFLAGNRLETAKWWMPTPELPEEEK